MEPWPVDRLMSPLAPNTLMLPLCVMLAVTPPTLPYTPTLPLGMVTLARFEPGGTRT